MLWNLGVLPDCSRFISAVQISFKVYRTISLQVMLSFYKSLIKLSSNDRILESKPNADKKVWVLPKDFSNHAKQSALINHTNSGTVPVSVRATGNISIQFSGCWIKFICNLGAMLDCSNVKSVKAVNKFWLSQSGPWMIGKNSTTNKQRSHWNIDLVADLSVPLFSCENFI